MDVQKKMEASFPIPFIPDGKIVIAKPEAGRADVVRGFHYCRSRFLDSDRELRTEMHFRIPSGFDDYATLFCPACGLRVTFEWDIRMTLNEIIEKVSEEAHFRYQEFLKSPRGQRYKKNEARLWGIPWLTEAEKIFK